MIKFNKIISFLLVVALALSLTSCFASRETNVETAGAGENQDLFGDNVGAQVESTSNALGNGNSQSLFVPQTTYQTTDTTVAMESSIDSFKLLEKLYLPDEKFVYTATVTFNSGVAAGLVFGAEDASHYWVFNVDRAANLVKLLYFTAEDGKTTAVELMTDYFIGNDKMTESERRLVGDKVATVEKVQLKVVITPEEDAVYAEFYADNIRRFGIDNTINLNDSDISEKAVYNGGNIGFNCFNSRISFADIYYGQSDYSYYTELYRNQYHFSQYAHWNNDPNGLVYYDGYYHLFYQHHPYSNYWSDMYWGHARSKDLAHWELLPICLFPDEDWGSGAGYMWSGTAYEYRKGDSDAIDALNWFPNGDGNGLIAFYTRDGGMQDQMIMSSDDAGITWTKRKMIPQTVATAADGIYHKVACRDPKVFPVEVQDGKTVTWGMALTGQQENRVWFLKSNNLLDWSYAGQFNANVPECPDVVTLTADDGEVYTVISLSGREYLVGKINYDGNIITFTDKDGCYYVITEFQNIKKRGGIIMANFEQTILDKLDQMEKRISAIEGNPTPTAPVKKHRHYTVSPEEVEFGHMAFVGRYKSADGSMCSTFGDDYVDIDSLLKANSFEMAKIIDAFSSEERINIVKELIQNTLSAKELMDKLKFQSTGKLYHHLSFLEKIGVIRKDGESFHVSAKYISCIVLIFTGVANIIRKNNER